MLQTIVMAEDNYKSIVRPAVYDSLIQVLRFYGLEDTTAIYYNGENEISKLVGTDRVQGSLKDIHTDGIFQDKLYVVADFQDTEFNNGYSNQRRQRTERPIWFKDDEECKLGIFPEFSGTRVEVSIVAVFNSLKTAQHYKNRINVLQSNQMVDMNFNATVHLVINNSILELWENIHTLLTKNNKETPLLGDWFDKYAKHPITTISNVAGNNKRLAAAYKFTDIGIQFSEPQIARTRKGSTHGRYEVEIKYSFFLNNFTHWHIEYPLNIYQDEIDKKWIPRLQDNFKQPFPTKANYETTFGLYGLRERSTQTPFRVVLPSHDAWSKPYEPWIAPILQARLKLRDEKDQIIINNIFQIPTFTWRDSSKEYFIRMGNKSLMRDETIFPFEIYEGNNKVNPSRLLLGEDHSLRLLGKPDLTKVYRMVLSINYALRNYSDDFWNSVSSTSDNFKLVERVFTEVSWPKIKSKLARKERLTEMLESYTVVISEADQPEEKEQLIKDKYEEEVKLILRNLPEVIKEVEAGYYLAGFVKQPMAVDLGFQANQHKE